MMNLPWQSEHLQPQLGRIFSDELRKHSWSSVLEPFYSRLLATESGIYEKLDGKQPLATALWNLCFPSVREGAFWHHTDLDSLQSILKGEEIWLHPISKRMGEGELAEFASTFGYRGFFSVNEKGDRLVDAAAEDLFYLSLTNEDGPSELLNYGEVRIKLRVTPVLSRSELRHMQYSTASDHPLIAMSKLARDRFERKFLPWGVSRMAAFLLDPFYSWESEVRLLVKRFDETTDLIMKKSGAYDVVALPLGKANSRALIDLVHIDADTPENLEYIRTFLSNTRFSSVTLGLQP